MRSIFVMLVMLCGIVVGKSKRSTSIFEQYCRYQWRIQDFPWGGGRGPVRRDVDTRQEHFLAKMYVKMKELGPVGGVRPVRPPPDPPMGIHSIWQD